ncbi:MAG: pseudaminic acid synthase [Candidatus Peribacteraceae bacterium]|nr:pseudaminic acid synthase [Candidatus Peribacteraceae bacterium]MDD5740299.1 pseudaminic acid synthase [Candidatus Peribacteraceae bacterium]
MKDKVAIKGRNIGPGHPVYIIAELSANHGQSFERACETIRAMKEAGADAVKLQTYTPDTMTIQCDREEFRIGKGSPWEGKTLYELYGEAYTPWEWQPKLKAMAEDLGLACFSTPFDATAVEFLEKMDVPAYKIASFELTDLPLIERVARTGKPLILSTGMASAEEIQEAADCARNADNDQIILLKCTSAYPAAAEEMNLRTIPDMYERFGVPVGLSDHSLELAVPVAAVALGACVIEKHFCLSRKEKGPDTAFSLEPEEFRAMVTAVRRAQTALGSVQFAPTEKEQASRVFRRSLFTVRDIAKGETFTAENVRCIRPGYGLPPKEIKNVLGRKARTAISRGTPLSWENVFK